MIEPFEKREDKDMSFLGMACGQGIPAKLQGFLILLFVWMPNAAIMGSDPLWAQGTAPPMRLVTDRAGRVVKVPVEPTRVACLFAPTIEKALLLGAIDKVVIGAVDKKSWARRINPNIGKIVQRENHLNPDVEKLIQMGVDLAFYHPYPKQLARISNAGIPVVVSYVGTVLPETLEGFFQDFRDQIRFYGDVLGANARRIAEEYCDYFDEKMKKVTSITSAIPTEKRPRVYYITGRNIYGTQGRHTSTYWMVEAAGGTMLTTNDNQYFVDVSMEQIIAWNPDTVIAGLPSTEPIMTDPRWRVLNAVKTGKVHIVPDGVFSWSHGSSEALLCVLFLAKALHPDRFHDLDIRKELKAFYSRFYHYALSDEEAGRILNRLPPSLRRSERLAPLSPHSGSTVKPSF